MDNWIPITINTLKEARVAELIDACSSEAKESGQPDRAPGIIQGVVNTVRRKVSNKNRVDEDPTTIPASLRDLAVDIIVCRLKQAVLLKLSDEEKEALKSAQDELNRIADGRDTVEQPPAPITPAVENHVGIELVQGGPGVATEEGLNGL